MASGGTLRKTQSNTRVGLISDPSTEPIYQRRFAKTSSRFNDSNTADVILNLHFEPSVNIDDVKLYLHLHALIDKSRYFSALISDRWIPAPVVEKRSYTFNVPSSMGSFDDTMTIMELFYLTDDDFPEAINTVSSALSILNAALLLQFKDCVKACVRFLEAVSWTKEEEQKVLSLIPLFQSNESQKLLTRLFTVTTNSCDEMPLGMVLEAVNSEHPDLASAKAFVAKFLRDFPSRDSLRYALTKTFEASLMFLKELLEQFSCSFLLGRTEKVEKVMSQARHIRWLIEMMIELRVGENAVKGWTNENFLTDKVIKFFRECQRKDIIPSLGIDAQVIGCTCRLATAVASGLILADVQVRMKLVKDWLPALIVSKREVLLPKTSIGIVKDESVYPALENAFLKIISTLPMTDSQELLKQCIRLSALNVEESPQLLSAFTTWFTRARTAQPSA